MMDSSQGGDALIGTTLGKYDIVRRLGKGGMATVYLGRQTSIGRTVAIKVMPQHFMHDDTFMQRFEREVRVIAELQHPRVLPVFDYGQIEGRPYIVMAYMAGGTLADRIEEGPMTLDEIARLVEQIAEGLDHAHRKGVIHRDFKPSNVLLDEHGNVYLADFGIAKISEVTVNLTGTGVVGTPTYMAPEMAREGAVTPAVDIYALGVTLYQMLTGRVPYEGQTPLSVMMAHATRPIPNVRAARPDLPEGITAVVERALAKTPEARYATAGELAEALKQAIAGQTWAPSIAGDQGVATAVHMPPGQQTLPEEAWVTPRPSTPRPPTAEPRTRTPTPPPPKKKGRRWGLIAAIVGVVVVVGCVIGGAALGGWALLSGSTPTPLPPPTDVPPTVAPTNPPPTEALGVGPSPTANTGGGATGAEASLIVDNQSAQTVCELYVSPRDSDSWGDNQLNADTVIASGDTFTLEGVPSGVYDMQALDCSQYLLASRYGVELNGSEIHWAVRDKDATLLVINNSDMAVCGVYVSSPGDTIWGLSQLGEDQLASGGQIEIAVADGTWDLRAEACEGDTYWEEYEVDISTHQEWTLNN
jgi:serine/threonine protein kinase